MFSNASRREEEADLYPIQDVQLAEWVEHNDRAAQEHAGDGSHRSVHQTRRWRQEEKKNREVKEQETSLRMNRFRRKGVEEEER